jgi:hypothetical protein
MVSGAGLRTRMEDRAERHPQWQGTSEGREASNAFSLSWCGGLAQVSGMGCPTQAGQARRPLNRSLERQTRAPQLPMLLLHPGICMHSAWSKIWSHHAARGHPVQSDKSHLCCTLYEAVWWRDSRSLLNPWTRTPSTRSRCFPYLSTRRSFSPAEIAMHAAFSRRCQAIADPGEAYIRRSACIWQAMGLLAQLSKRQRWMTESTPARTPYTL